MLAQHVQQPQKITLGLAKFDYKFTNQIKKQIITVYHQQTLQKQEWNLDSKKFMQNKWIQGNAKNFICVNDILNSDFNYDSEIIRKILQPIFINLKWLNLSGNNIKNIESLSFLNIQNLQMLGLCNFYFTNIIDNLLFNLTSLNKTKWNQVCKITLRNNIIKDTQLNRMKFKKITQRLSFYYYPTDLAQKEDSAFVMKLQANQLKQIDIHHQRIIKQSKVIESLKRRYNDIKINT